MTLSDILRDLEADALPGAAGQFHALVTDYLERSRKPSDPRPVPCTAAELEELFDEPLPRAGRPLSQVVGRLSHEVVPNANWLTHPRYLGHQVSAPLPPAIWTEGFLCSRRADALKLWVALQRCGADGLGALYDHLCATAEALYQAILPRTDFEVLHRPECNILYFRYVDRPRRAEVELDNLNGELRERFNRFGRGWITTTLLGGRRVLRVTVMNSRTGVREVEEMLDDLAALAHAE